MTRARKIKVDDNDRHHLWQSPPLINTYPPHRVFSSLIEVDYRVIRFVITTWFCPAKIGPIS